MARTPKKASDRRAEILAALKAAGGNVTRAAGALGVSRQTLYHYVSVYGLEKEFGIVHEEDPRPDPPVPGGEDEKRQISVKLPADLWLWVRITALQQRTTAGALIAEAIERRRAEIEREGQ